MSNTMNKFLSQEEIQKLAENYSESTCNSDRDDLSDEDKGELYDLEEKELEEWIPDRTYKWFELVKMNTIRRDTYHGIVLKDNRQVTKDLKI